MCGIFFYKNGEQISPELEEISLEENVFYQKVTYIDINNSIVHRYNVTFRIIYGELLIIMIYDGLTVTYVYKDDILNVKK